MQEPVTEKQELEIDYKAIALRLWNKRRFIFKIFSIFCALGLLSAIIQVPVYTASCTFVPNRSSKSASASSLSSLAAMAGINLGDMSAGQDLSPVIYPQLLDNIELRKELMRTPLHLKDFESPVSLLDLTTNPEYRKFTLSSAVESIKKYTILLPFTILSAIKGKPDEVSVPQIGEDSPAVSYFTREEYECSKALSKIISMTVDKKEGYLTLSANFREALASAELCQAAFLLVNRYVSDFKLKNAVFAENFIRERYEEAKKDYEDKQLALATFTDANRGMLTATAQVRRDQLISDYNLSYYLFSEISKQLLQAEMKVKEDTPVLSPVKPVSFPMKKSNSRTKTLLAWIFFGMIASCGSVVLFDWLKENEINWPKNWL